MLVPIRYGRMLRSSLTFLRGSAALMAYDLATTPANGIGVQACGDCHLLNRHRIAQQKLYGTPVGLMFFEGAHLSASASANLHRPWLWALGG